MAKSTIVGTDSVYAALYTRCNANFTELYNMLTGVAAIASPQLSGTVTGTYTLGGTPTITVASWTDVSSFGTGWAAGSATTISYMKDPMGFVHLRGLLAGSPGGANVAFTLPSGYRPAIAHHFGPSATSTPWQIQTDGDVYSSSVTDVIVLDGVIFKAA